MGAYVCVLEGGWFRGTLTEDACVHPRMAFCDARRERQTQMHTRTHTHTHTNSHSVCMYVCMYVLLMCTCQRIHVMDTDGKYQRMHSSRWRWQTRSSTLPAFCGLTRALNFAKVRSLGSARLGFRVRVFGFCVQGLGQVLRQVLCLRAPPPHRPPTHTQNTYAHTHK
jgi:hypothetical protein